MRFGTLILRAYAKTPKSLRCSYSQNMDVAEDLLNTSAGYSLEALVHMR